MNPWRIVTGWQCKPMDRENAAEAHSSKCRTASQPKKDY